MKTSLQEIYFDVLDRIFLNEGNVKHKIAREQYEKDLVLKEQIEKVFENPDQYDAYYQKDTLQLCIDPIPEESGMKRNLFNRIDIQY